MKATRERLANAVSWVLKRVRIRFLYIVAAGLMFGTAIYGVVAEKDYWLSGYFVVCGSLMVYGAKNCGDD